MAVTFDSVASNSGYPPNGISVSHSLGSGSGNNRIVFVTILTVGGTGNTISACTYDGVQMNLLRQLSYTYYGRETWVRTYYLLDASMPSSSGTKTAAVTFSGDAYYGIVSAVSYEDVKQTAPSYASSSAFGEPQSGQYSTSITTSAVSGMLVDFGGVEKSTYLAATQTPGSGQTERLDYLYETILLAISEKVFSSAGSNSMSQTPDSTYAYYGHIVVELEDYSATGGMVLLGSGGYSVASGTAVSGSYTCHTGTNRKLLVAVCAEQSAGLNVNSVTYNGVSLTKIMEIDHSTTYNVVAWFYMDDSSFPSTAGTYTLQANFSGTAYPGMLMVMELGGAEQGAPDAYASSETSSSATISTSITTLSNDSWIVGAVVSGEEVSYNPQSGQTELVEISEVPSSGGASSVMGYEEISVAGSTSMDWLATPTANRLLQAVLAIAPAQAVDYNVIMMGSNF